MHRIVARISPSIYKGFILPSRKISASSIVSKASKFEFQPKLQRSVIEKLMGSNVTSYNELVNQLHVDELSHVTEDMLRPTLINLAVKYRHLDLAQQHLMAGEFDQALSDTVVWALVTKSRHDLNNLKRVGDIMRHFPQFKLSSSMCHELMAQCARAPLPLVKELVNLVNTSLSQDGRHKVVLNLYQLIVRDHAAGNTSGVFTNWIKAKDYYVTLLRHDPFIIGICVDSFTKDHSYLKMADQLVNSIPREMYPELVPSLLNYCAQRGLRRLDLAKKVISDMDIGDRKSLSALLRLYLKFNDSEGVDSVLRLVREQHGSLGSVEYKYVVHSLLQKHKLSQCIDFLGQIPVRKATPSYVSLISYLVDNGLKVAERDIISKLVEKVAAVDRGNKFWEFLASLWVKDRNITAKNALYSLLSSERALKEGQPVTVDPFASKQPVLKITDSNRVLILRQVMDKAMAERDMQCFRHALAHLYRSGMTVGEIKVMLGKRHFAYLRKIGYSSFEEMERELIDASSYRNILS